MNKATVTCSNCDSVAEYSMTHGMIKYCDKCGSRIHHVDDIEEIQGDD